MQSRENSRSNSNLLLDPSNEASEDDGQLTISVLRLVFDYACSTVKDMYYFRRVNLAWADTTENYSSEAWNRIVSRASFRKCCRVGAYWVLSCHLDTGKFTDLVDYGLLIAMQRGKKNGGDEIAKLLLLRGAAAVTLGVSAGQGEKEEHLNGMFAQHFIASFGDHEAMKLVFEARGYHSIDLYDERRLPKSFVHASSSSNQKHNNNFTKNNNNIDFDSVENNYKNNNININNNDSSSSSIQHQLKWKQLAHQLSGGDSYWQKRLEGDVEIFGPRNHAWKKVQELKKKEQQKYKNYYSSSFALETKVIRKYTCLHYAVESGDTKTVALVLQKGATVDALSEPLHYTPLMLACGAGCRSGNSNNNMKLNPEIVFLLLRQPLIMVGCIDIYGNSALHHICSQPPQQQEEEGKNESESSASATVTATSSSSSLSSTSNDILKIVEFIIERGGSGSLHRVNHQENTPFELACLAGNYALMQKIVELQEKYTPASFVANNNNFSSKQQKQNIEQQQQQKQNNNNKPIFRHSITLLHKVIREKKFDIARHLLNCGADINMKHHGVAPLQILALVATSENGGIQLMKEIIIEGKFSANNNNSSVDIVNTCSFEHFSNATMEQKAVTAVGCGNNSSGILPSDTPLSIAASVANVDVVKFLLSLNKEAKQYHGSEVNIHHQNNQGKNCLFFAVNSVEHNGELLLLDEENNNNNNETTIGTKRNEDALKIVRMLLDEKASMFGLSEQQQEEEKEKSGKEEVIHHHHHHQQQYGAFPPIEAVISLNNYDMVKIFVRHLEKDFIIPQNWLKISIRHLNSSKMINSSSSSTNKNNTPNNKKNQQNTAAAAVVDVTEKESAAGSSFNPLASKILKLLLQCRGSSSTVTQSINNNEVGVGTTETPLLLYACQQEAPAAIEILYETGGADLTVSDRHGRNCLHLAVDTNSKQTVETLVDILKERDPVAFEKVINQKELRGGLTPLLYAIFEGRSEEIVEILVSTSTSNGNNSNHISGKDGRNAIHLALTQHHNLAKRYCEILTRSKNIDIDPSLEDPVLKKIPLQIAKDNRLLKNSGVIAVLKAATAKYEYERKKKKEGNSNNNNNNDDDNKIDVQEKKDHEKSESDDDDFYFPEDGFIGSSVKNSAFSTTASAAAAAVSKPSSQSSSFF